MSEQSELCSDVLCVDKNTDRTEAHMGGRRVCAVNS